MAREYVVDVREVEDGPDATLRERFAVCAARRLARIESETGELPVAGGDLEIMDGFEGPFVWEMTDAEFEANPPSSVYLTIVSVDPADPGPDTTVRVTVDVVF